MKNLFIRLGQILKTEGLLGVLDHAWIKLELFAKRNRTRVTIDGCTFVLDDVPVHTTRVDLLTSRYEREERRAVIRHLPRKMPVVELGGSLGVVACLTNRLLADPTAHVVVEANPLVIPHLVRNKELNQCQFEIVNKAIAYGTPSVTFSPAIDSFGSSTVRNGEGETVTVDAVRLGDLVHDRGFTGFTLICDIEGLEYEVVCEEPQIMREASLIIMETHARLIGEDKVQSMMNKLHYLGYRVIERRGFVIVLQR